MNKRDAFTKILAIIGTLLVLFPILAPIVFSTARYIKANIFRFDYLMPAELFLFALVGGGALFWAALRARSRQKLIGWGIGIATCVLIGGQVLAVATGLASGETEPDGWSWVLVLSTLAVYSLSVIVIGIGGLLLLRDLFVTRKSPKEVH